MVWTLEDMPIITSLTSGVAMLASSFSRKAAGSKNDEQRSQIVTTDEAPFTHRGCYGEDLLVPRPYANECVRWMMNGRSVRDLVMRSSYTTSALSC